FAQLMQAQQYPASWAFALVDGKGEFIARLPDMKPGTRVSPDFAAALARSPEGWFRGRTLEGRDAYTAHRRSALAGWAVGVAIPSDEVLATAWRTAGYITAAAVLSLLMAMVFAWWLGGRIARPIGQLAAAA